MKHHRLLRACLGLTATLAFAACIDINGTGYKDLSAEEKAHVKECTLPIDSLTNDGNLYQVKVALVEDYLKKHPQTLVYSYLPFCNSDSTCSPSFIKSTCDSLHLNLLVITSVYDDIFPIPEFYSFPLLVIDPQPYDTDNYQKLTEKFYEQLTHVDDDERVGESYLLFQHDRFVKGFSSLKALKSSIAVR